MRLNRYAATALMLAASGGAWADSVTVDLNDKAVRGIYAFTPAAKRGLEIDVGHYYTEHSAYVTHLGMQVAGENWSKQGVFNIGVGGRVVYAHAGDYSDAALAFGGKVRFSPVQRLGISGAIFFAPEVTSFMDGKSYTETEFNVDYQVLPQAFVFAGYRTINVDFDNVDNVKFDDRVHFGMKVLF